MGPERCLFLPLALLNYLYQSWSNRCFRVGNVQFYVFFVLFFPQIKSPFLSLLFSQLRSGLEICISYSKQSLWGMCISYNKTRSEEVLLPRAFKSQMLINIHIKRMYWSPYFSTDYLSQYSVSFALTVILVVNFSTPRHTTIFVCISLLGSQVYNGS